MQEHSPCTPCTEHAVAPGPGAGGCCQGWRGAAPSPGSPPPASWPPPPPSATATSPPSPLQGTIAWVRSQSYHSFHGLQCLYTLILQLLTTEEWGVCGWRPNTGGCMWLVCNIITISAMSSPSQLQSRWLQHNTLWTVHTLTSSVSLLSLLCVQVNF